MLEVVLGERRRVRGMSGLKILVLLSMLEVLFLIYGFLVEVKDIRKLNRKLFN